MLSINFFIKIAILLAIAVLLPLLDLYDKFFGVFGLSATEFFSQSALWCNIFISSSIVSIGLIIILSFSVHKLYIMSKFSYQTGLSTYEGFKEFYDNLPRKGVGYTSVVIELMNFKDINNLFGYAATENFLYDLSIATRQFLNKHECAVKTKDEARCDIILKTNDMAIVKERMNKLIAQLNKIQVKKGKTVYNFTGKFAFGIHPITGTEENFENLINITSTGIVSADDIAHNLTVNDLTLREELMDDIVDALSNNQFVPYFQTRHNLISGNVISVEMLSRWKHPKYGIIRPRIFIPLLEVAGYIDDLDLYMFEIACKMVRGWIDSEITPIPLIVNVSILNAYQSNFMPKFINIFKENQFSPKLIEIAISFPPFFNDNDTLSSIFLQFKRMGFPISLNLGHSVYYSSHLFHLPFDDVTINLNNNFEKNDMRLRIVKYLTDNMNITIIIKGIETQEQLYLLKNDGYSYGQGKVFSAPVSRDTYENAIFNAFSKPSN